MADNHDDFPSYHDEDTQPIRKRDLEEFQRSETPKEKDERPIRVFITNQSSTVWAVLLIALLAALVGAATGAIVTYALPHLVLP